MTRQKKTTLCPLGGVGVGGKWKFWIWYHLLSGTRRFGQLQRLVPQASRQMLTIQLRELEQVGALHRRVSGQAPLTVEYSLTERAQRLGPAVRQMYAWGQWYSAHIGMEYDDFLVALGGRWRFWIWYLLLSGPKHFGELHRLLPRANRQTLSTQLRELERMGVVHRRRPEQDTLRVEYSLTELAQQSGPILRQLYAWGRWYCDEVGLDYDWPVAADADLTPSVRELAG